MSEEQSSAQSRGATVRVEDSQNVYHTLFEKINLEPLDQMGGIDAYQSVDALSEATANERVTASVSVFLERLKQVSPQVERLDPGRC